MDLSERGTLRVRYAEKSREEGLVGPAVIEPAGLHWLAVRESFQ
jgi:hypothetical protein